MGVPQSDKLRLGRDDRPAEPYDVAMRALMYGVEPEVQPIGETDNRLLRMLARTPTRLIDIDEPGFLRPDWVVTRPRLVGICGSESKAVFLDYASLIDPANAAGQNPMKNFVSMPHVMGHEVIADVVAVGPEAEGLEPGDRVALNPWLTCVTRGVSPVCPACEAGDLSQCHSFAKGSFAPGIHIGMCADVSGGFADLMPAHDSMLFKVPDTLSDEQVVVADPFSVSLHAVTRHPPQPGSKVLVYGAGALGQCAIAILRALYPTVEVMAVARFDAQRQLAETFGASTVHPEPRLELIERVADWSGGVLQPADGLPMAFPGGIDVVYDTIGAAETLEVGCRVLARPRDAGETGHARRRQMGRHAGVHQGDHLHGFQRLRDRGGRGRPSARHRPLPGHGRIRPDRPDTDADPHVPS